jgi:hypothetical protein
MQAELDKAREISVDDPFFGHVARSQKKSTTISSRLLSSSTNEEAASSRSQQSWVR